MLVEPDAKFLHELLADDFIWVHNHASSVLTKAPLLERVESLGSTGRSRVSILFFEDRLDWTRPAERPGVPQEAPISNEGQ